VLSLSSNRAKEKGRKGKNFINDFDFIDMKLALSGGKIITPFKIIQEGVILIENSIIKSVGRLDEISIPKGFEIIDVKSNIVCPGFIDIHCHGGNGISFNKDLPEKFFNYSQWVTSTGVTSFLITIVPTKFEETIKKLKNIRKIFEFSNYIAEPLGIHLEGPFLNPKKHGAIDSEWIRNPDLNEMSSYISASNNKIKMVTMASELEGSKEIVNLLKQNDIIISLGHTDATYKQTIAAFKNGYNHVTHCFNAMRGFDYNEPGVVGAVLQSKGIYTEIICDGIHVDPSKIKRLIDNIGVDKVVLITDANKAAGLCDGKYSFLDKEILVKNRKATLKDGTITGSVINMNEAFKNMVRMVGASIQDAIKMVTINPAKSIKFDKNLGSLERGKKADIIVMDKDLNLLFTIKNGKTIKHE